MTTPPQPAPTPETGALKYYEGGMTRVGALIAESSMSPKLFILACQLQKEKWGLERSRDELAARLVEKEREADKHYTRLAGILFSGALDTKTSAVCQLWAAEYVNQRKRAEQAEAALAQRDLDNANYAVLCTRHLEALQRSEAALRAAREEIVNLKAWLDAARARTRRE